MIYEKSQLLEKLNHQTIVKCYGVETDLKTGQLCQVLWFANHGNLKEFLEFEGDEFSNIERCYLLC